MQRDLQGHASQLPAHEGASRLQAGCRVGDTHSVLSAPSLCGPLVEKMVGFLRAEWITIPDL